MERSQLFEKVLRPRKTIFIRKARYVSPGYLGANQPSIMPMTQAAIANVPAGT